jgi:hypothetical protein
LAERGDLAPKIGLLGMALWPEQKRGVVVMCNSEYANPGKLAARLLKIVMLQDSQQSE